MDYKFRGSDLIYHTGDAPVAAVVKSFTFTSLEAVYSTAQSGLVEIAITIHIQSTGYDLSPTSQSMIDFTINGAGCPYWDTSHLNNGVYTGSFRIAVADSYNITASFRGTAYDEPIVSEPFIAVADGVL